jgi:hypothetical protein
MPLLPNFMARRMAFEPILDIPPTKFTVDEKWVNKWRANTQYTPDAALLSRQEFQPIFVYDRHMEGRDDFADICGDIHELPSPVGFSCETFCTWRKNLGKLSFPIALPAPQQNHKHPLWADLARETCWFKDAPPALIKGIIYTINSSAFFSLDRHYRNGLHFTRKKIKIQIPCRYKEETGGNEYMLTQWAWAYIGRSEYWSDQLDAGMFFSPVRIFKPKNALLTEYSFFEQPTGEPPREEPPVVFEKITQVSIPLLDANGRVVGSGFEHVWVPQKVEENPYKTLLDGASPVQRIINKEN